jgi:hypothetical protein
MLVMPPSVEVAVGEFSVGGPVKLADPTGEARRAWPAPHAVTAATRTEPRLLKIGIAFLLRHDVPETLS